MLDFKIPPALSNWKNSKGYTIPLEMRLSADGRALIQHTIHENHA
jgi:SNW domain-containing protein 1